MLFFHLVPFTKKPNELLLAPSEEAESDLGHKESNKGVSECPLL